MWWYKTSIKLAEVYYTGVVFFTKYFSNLINYYKGKYDVTEKRVSLITN